MSDLAVIPSTINSAPERLVDAVASASNELGNLAPGGIEPPKEQPGAFPKPATIQEIDYSMSREDRDLVISREICAKVTARGVDTYNKCVDGLDILYCAGTPETEMIVAKRRAVHMQACRHAMSSKPVPTKLKVRTFTPWDWLPQTLADEHIIGLQIPGPVAVLKLARRSYDDDLSYGRIFLPVHRFDYLFGRHHVCYTVEGATTNMLSLCWIAAIPNSGLQPSHALRHFSVLFPELVPACRAFMLAEYQSAGAAQHALNTMTHSEFKEAQTIARIMMQYSRTKQILAIASGFVNYRDIKLEHEYKYEKECPPIPAPQLPTDWLAAFFPMQV